LSFFTRRKPQSEERGTLPGGWWPSSWAVPTASGQVVNAETAMRSAAVAACVRVLKTSVAMLPVDVVRIQGKTRIEVTAPPVVQKPSARVSQRAWVSQMMDSYLLAGNAYGQVTAVDRLQHPVQVESVAHGDVTWLAVDGSLHPYVRSQRSELWPVGDLIHLPASAFLPAGTRVALSPVELAKQSIGAGLAAEQFGAGFFGAAGHPSSIIYSDQALTADQAENIKARFKEAVKPGVREPAVFGSGLKYEPIQVNPSDSQFIDLLRFEVEQACRFFGVPPTMVYAAVSGQNITYSNITHNDLHFLKYSLTIWLADLEDAWSAMLDEPLRIKFNVDALLRMDATARWAIHDLRLKNRTTSVNEVRALEDQSPIPDPEYDVPGVPGTAQQLSAAEAVQKVYRGVGSILTSDEAREIVNAAGGNLTVPAPTQLPLPIQ